MERNETDFTVGNLYIFANISKGTDFLLRGLKIRGFQTMIKRMEVKDP